MLTTTSQLVFQRDGQFLVTRGAGRDRLVALARQCGQLRAVIADDYLYDISPVALWGAAARGLTAPELVLQLDAAAATPAPARLAACIADEMARYGSLVLEQSGDDARLVTRDASLLDHLGIDRSRALPDGSVPLNSGEIARVTLAAARAGWPIVDRRVVSIGCGGLRFASRYALRSYQRDALTRFLRVGSGVVLLPCGAGKTAVGVSAAAATGGTTLVLVPSRSIAEQWHRAFLNQTSVEGDAVRVIVGRTDVAPVSIATYHAAAFGRLAGELMARQWNLVIYDEVQSLPADVFRVAAGLQARRRLGLTATLVREDGREREVAALVGPPLYDVSWLELEREGWIAPARCVEVRVPPGDTPAATTRHKIAALQRLLQMHEDEPTLVVGTNVASLLAAGKRLSFPALTGQSSSSERSMTLEQFRRGAIPVLGLSRIGSVGIDLPNASALIQISGAFGSRQEEAQRLGRIIRARPGKSASFYTLVAAATREQHFAARRQRFLVNQGYQYEILDAADLPRVIDSASGSHR